MDPQQARQENVELFAGPFGRVYSFYMERPAVSRLVARALWGVDMRPYYAGMTRIGELPAGATVLDAPCGAGVAFRGVRPGQDLRYLAIDISPDMLERARKRAAARGLDQIELVEGAAEETGLPDAAADLFLSYWGLHCFADPERGIAEAARTLRPGGELIGSSFLDGDSLRHRWLRRGCPSLPADGELERWLGESFERVEIERSGPAAFFTAVRAA